METRLRQVAMTVFALSSACSGSGMLSYSADEQSKPDVQLNDVGALPDVPDYVVPDVGRPPDVGGVDGGTRTDTGFNDSGANSDTGGQIDSGNGGTDSGSPTGGHGTLATGLTLSEIAILQYAKIPIMKDGVWVSATLGPTIANRAARVRAYVVVDGSWQTKSVTGHFDITHAGKTQSFAKTLTISQDSNDAIAGSYFDFVIPADANKEGAVFSLELVETNSPATTHAGVHTARFPRAGGAHGFGTQANGLLRIKVVPLKYDPDGSGRLPDTSMAAMNTLKGFFAAALPGQAVELTVRSQPVSVTAPIVAGSFDGWSTALALVKDTRIADAPDDDVHYIGLVNPAATFEAYCSLACSAGKGYLGYDYLLNYPAYRSAVAVGFTDHQTTPVHEVVHTMGLDHIGCRTMNTPGWDERTQSLLSTDSWSDFMGYCINRWGSTASAPQVHKRLRDLNSLASMSGARVLHRSLYVSASGRTSWSTSTSLQWPANPSDSHSARVVALDEHGLTISVVTALGIELSEGTEKELLIPEVARAAYYRLPDGTLIVAP